MKTLLSFENSKTRTLIIIAFFSFSLLFLSSCLKNSDSDNNTIGSALTVIHASPDTEPFDFVLNRSAVLPQNVSYATRIPYFSLYSGTYEARFYKHNTYTDPLYSTDINLAQGKYYSLFLTGLEADLTNLLIEDDLSRPEEGKAKLRFVNVSPDAGALDFSIVTDSLFASNKNFKEYTAFYNIAPGTYSATFSSHTGEAVDFDFELKLERGKTYTVVARGLVETTNEDQKLENGLINHSE